MNQFQTIEGITNLFAQAKCIANQNNMFYCVANKTKIADNPAILFGGVLGGIAAGMKAAEDNRAWDGYLVNSTEYGIGLIPLKNTNALLCTNIDTMTVHLEAFMFLNNDIIDSIKIRRANLISPVAKDVTIKLKNGPKFELIVMNKEKKLPYHEANFTAFVNQYKK